MMEQTSAPLEMMRRAQSCLIDGKPRERQIDFDPEMMYGLQLQREPRLMERGE